MFRSSRFTFISLRKERLTIPNARPSSIVSGLAGVLGLPLAIAFVVYTARTNTKDCRC